MSLPNRGGNATRANALVMRNISKHTVNLKNPSWRIVQQGDFAGKAKVTLNVFTRNEEAYLFKSLQN